MRRDGTYESKSPREIDWRFSLVRIHFALEFLLDARQVSVILACVCSLRLAGVLERLVQLLANALPCGLPSEHVRIRVHRRAACRGIFRVVRLDLPVGILLKFVGFSHSA